MARSFHLLLFGFLTLVLHSGASATARLPEPTQFEHAMTLTIRGVQKGTLPDPNLRKADGTPGTILEALLPRRIQAATNLGPSSRRILLASWKRIGSSLPFSLGPTLSAFNQSYFRYASVTPLPALDWRTTAFVTPIQVQFKCESCWLMAAADTVAMASAIATGSAPQPAGIQQVCDCGGLTCCQGGWPEAAYSWMTAQGGITTNAAYNYWAMDGRSCTLGSSFPLAGNITGFERVPSYNQTALMKAVSMQPVLVYISSSAPDFIGYNSTAPGTAGFYVYNGSCSTEVDHAVILVGYNISASVPYWIAKNTWPYWGWGDRGYMYLAMTGDGPGMCGIQMLNPLFPISFPTAPQQLTVSSSNPYDVEISGNSFWWKKFKGSTNACKNVINPCGVGLCNSSSGIARCSCPAGYVEMVGVPTSKCISATPCTDSVFNPCGPGACMNVGDGTYICQCPASFVIGSQVSGAPTCVPVLSITTNGSTYVTQYGDSCTSLAAAFNIPVATFQTLNPGLNCNPTYLPPGLVVLLQSLLAGCTAQYAVRAGDTCNLIAYNVDNNPNFLSWLNTSFWNSSGNVTLQYTVPALSANVPSSAWNYPTTKLLALNPALQCSNLFLSQLICVKAQQAVTTTTPCKTTYTTVRGDTCLSIQFAFGLSNSTFSKLNPGLTCSWWNSWEGHKSWLPSGIQVCVSATVAAAATPPPPPTPTPATPAPPSSNGPICSQYYSVQQGDSCAQIWNAANLSQYQFFFINPGLQCQAPLFYVGQQVCINSSVLASIQDPNYLTYVVQARDNLTTIQAVFMPKCEPYSITVSQLAAANGFADWTAWVPAAGTSIIIPCVPKVGASCGCVPSLAVCGADFYNYPSYCDATCNFASPITTGACSTCQNACAGRYGLSPSPTSACASGYVCPYPSWPPLVSEVTKMGFTCTTATGGQCMCNYRQRTCTYACGQYASTTGGSATACYSACYHCAIVPCGGPNQIVSPSSSFCGGSCTSSGTNVPCNPFGRSQCQTQCTYWNNWWLTNSQTKPAFNP